MADLRHPAEIIARIGIRVERMVKISGAIAHRGGWPTGYDTGLSERRVGWWMPQVSEPWRGIGRADGG